MAVSLKKPVKVDLSKPDLPPKVREYTSVHILDEEETIHKSSASVSADVSDVIPSRSELPDSSEVLETVNKHKLKRIFIAFLPVLIGVVLIAFFAVYLRYLPDMLSAIAPDDSDHVESTVSIIYDLWDFISTSPIIVISLLLSAIGLIGRCCRNITKWGGD